MAHGGPLARILPQRDVCLWVPEAPEKIDFRVSATDTTTWLSWRNLFHVLKESGSCLTSNFLKPVKRWEQLVGKSQSGLHISLPFFREEATALQKQALHAVISSSIPLQIFEDPEMKNLFGMLRSTAPDIIPMGRVLGGRLLNEVAAEVEIKTEKVLRKRKLGLFTDGWKSTKKESVNAVCANVEFKLYLLELIDATALNKDGPSLCEQFGLIINQIEEKYNCIVIEFTTDADGGSKKGCLVTDDATALIGRIVVLAYLVSNLIHWTTHFIAFLGLFSLCSALQLAVLQKISAIVAAEVGAATSTEAQCLSDDVNRLYALIEDVPFWSGLKTIVEDKVCVHWWTEEAKVVQLKFGVTSVDSREDAQNGGCYVAVRDKERSQSGSYAKTNREMLAAPLSVEVGAQATSRSIPGIVRDARRLGLNFLCWWYVFWISWQKCEMGEVGAVKW
ncbi:hypothetical protein K438DRAFT_1781381 [Mycena galopus ATCC 62051]|nr:hypothetical protein K438DRAFT_1781381 [Mycena galopus ATCC 62051]